ncbi:hypothetical protein CPB83DRAFT_765016 [Crepidotus variabilis]|uniref:Transmembrane protein n=1 Tax=Crepidotus variabilis TaxID=179855 RepID=A0A9P6JR39_9AGAR|nr:hypothetical protein CPB83DRAFT_765016 [Crepidotus variabilis]
MSKRAIIVDDSHPSINYVGDSWISDQGSHDNKGNYGPPFKSTLHGTTSSASFSFQFSGTGIKVYGSNDKHNDSVISDPKWSCFIDQQSITASKPEKEAQNHRHLCENNNLKPQDGPHTLTVNVTVAQNQTFWFDRIEYVPSSTVSLDDSLILIESNDAEFRYRDGWKKSGTANMTKTNGASFEFGFTGISVTWFSWVLSGEPGNSTNGTWAIDGGSRTTFNINGHTADLKTTQYNQKLFETPTLPMGQHNLSVVYNGNKDTIPLTLDYLVVQNGTSSTTQTLSSTGSKISNDNHNNDNPPIQKSNVGAIVGSVIGSVSVLIILSILFIFLRRRRRSHHRPTFIGQVDPFEYQSFHHPQSKLSAGSHSAQSASFLYYAGYGSGRKT